MRRIILPFVLPFLLLAGPAKPSPPSEEVLALSESVREIRRQREARIIDDFVTLLRLPNVARDLPDIRRNADHIEGLFRERGFETRQLAVSEDAPPAVFAQRLVDPGAPTLLIYAHYDGQPAQAENWASPPWQPTLRDGMVEDGARNLPLEGPYDPDWRLFARSAGDDKAPVIALIHALDALETLGRPLSVNLKLFFDGEEEIGSPHLEATLRAHQALLASDLWLFCDGPMHPTRRLQLAYGVRGAIGFNVTVYGPRRPLHSGHYGNWAPNPVVMLSHLVASMRDTEGQVLIPGFYDEVNEPTALERAAIAAIPQVDIALRQELGLARTEGGERVELRILQPALNLRGFRAGDVGAASRNIILPEATASFGIRLVPGQTIDHLKHVVEGHLEAQGYHLVREPPDENTRMAHPRIARITWGDGYPAYRTPLDHPMAQAVSGLLDTLAGGELIHSPTMGGSLPLYLIGQVLNTPVIILPVANHDNNQHGKDENLRLGNLWDAIEIYAVTLALLGERLPSE